MRRRTVRKEHNERYRFSDFLLDVLFFIPELLFLPFRLLVWLVRPLLRLISDIW